MGLLIGIDEAGYGPHLGPLVVAAAGLKFRGDALPSPDLWPVLRTCVARQPREARSRVLICDSKAAYATGHLAPLERTALALLSLAGRRPRTFADLLDAVAVGSEAARPAPAGDAAGQPWLRPGDLALPWQATVDEVEAAAARLGEGLALAGAAAGPLWVNVATAAQFNRLVAEGRNKADVLFALAAEILADVLARADGPVHVTMDRHGGRRYYGDLLSAAFPMTGVETVEESAAMSRYCLRRPAAAVPAGSGAGGDVALTVRDRCESWSLPTALASMAAKYVRELAMVQFNAYFRSRVPDLRPTAGYGRDAWRFLAETAGARAAAGLDEGVILRCR